jgi:phage FluMu protein Com
MVRNIEEGAAAPRARACEDVRCGCGSLLARVVDGAVELKCRRCKRVWRLALEAEPAAGRGRLSEGGAP